MMKEVLDIVFSPYAVIGRGVWTILIVLYLTGVIHMGMIDVTNYGLNEEFMVPMLIAVLVMGLLTAIGLRRYYHDKAATKAGYENPFDMAYDKRYDFGTAVGFILGAAAGMYMAPAVVDYVFIGAGMWTFVLVSGLCAALMVVVITTLIRRYRKGRRFRGQGQAGRGQGRRFRRASGHRHRPAHPETLKRPEKSSFG